jgi:hypothetical protein
MLPLAVCALLLIPAALSAEGSFDGTWDTTLTCPPKGDTAGFTTHFPSTVTAGNLRGERGTAGAPGYMLLTGAIAANGSAKLTLNGIIANRAYARGVFAHKGEEYSWDAKAQFQATTGSGTRDRGSALLVVPAPSTSSSRQPLLSSRGGWNTLGRR